jgi:diacylglycerol kinase
LHQDQPSFGRHDMAKFIKSFGYAFSGIAYAFKSQFNFRFHVVALFIVGLAGWYFQLSANEWLWIVAATGIVLLSELFNTAIEVLVDLGFSGYSSKSKGH